MTHNLKVRSSSLLSQFSLHAKVWCNYARSHLDVSFPVYLEVNISVALKTSGIIEALWIFSHYFILTDNLKHHIIQRTVNFLDALWLQMHCSLAQWFSSGSFLDFLGTLSPGNTCNLLFRALKNKQTPFWHGFDSLSTLPQQYVPCRSSVSENTFGLVIPAKLLILVQMRRTNNMPAVLDFAITAQDERYLSEDKDKRDRQTNKGSLELRVIHSLGIRAFCKGWTPRWTVYQRTHTGTKHQVTSTGPTRTNSHLSENTK